MSDDNIKKLPVKFKEQPSDDDAVLKVLHFDPGCSHDFAIIDGKVVTASYSIREGETEVECSLCATRLDPMFVLKKLANAEGKWLQTRKKYQEEMKRLSERSRTKCQHCGDMTRISRS